VDKVIFNNNLGVLSESFFCLSDHGVVRTFSYTQLRKIQLQKFRDNTANVLILLIAAVILLCSFMVHAQIMIIIGIVLFFAVFFTINMLLNKKYVYKIQLITHQYQPIHIKVHHEGREDAKLIVKKIKERLQPEESYLKAV
jgi:hypothetical protein